MKKVLAICLMLVMIVSVSVTAFADPGAFLISPSKNRAPEVVSTEKESDDCTAEIVITPYSERDKLPDDQRKNLEDAYSEIVGTTDLTKLTKDLEELAKKLGVDPSDLAVSDLFNAHYTGCDGHDDHGYIKVAVTADTLKNYVGLLVRKGDKWELDKTANLKEENGQKYLYFHFDEPAPYAVVVNGGLSGNLSQTGDNSLIYVYAIIMAVSAIAIVVIAIKSRKQKV